MSKLLPMSTFGESADDELLREAAERLWCSSKLQIDEGATISSSEKGAWVGAWVWVNNADAGIEDHEEDE